MKARVRKRRRRPSRTPRGVFRPRRYLLTHNEAAFLRVLITLIGSRYVISCKVRLADIITYSAEDWKRGYANRIARSAASETCLSIVFARKRVLLVRIPASSVYDRDMIASHFREASLNLWDGD